MNRKASENRKQTGAPGPSASAWMLFFLACGCMFFIGVLVGRNTMPVRFDMEDLNRKLGQLQSSVLAEDAAREIGRSPASPVPETDFDFYEKLRDDRAYVFSEEEMPLRRISPRFEKNIPESAVIAGTPEAERDARIARRETPERSLESASDSQTEGSSDSQADSQADRPQPVERRTAESSVQADTGIRWDPSGGGWVIQVASLRDIEKAETVRDKFKERGYPAYTQQAIVEGRGKWSRVRIGPYRDREQAGRDLARLQQAGVDAILLSGDHD